MTELLPTLPPCFRHALHPPWGLRIHSTRAAAGQTPPLWPTPLVGTRSLDCGGRNKWARMAQCWRQHHQQFPAVKLTGCPEFNPIGSKRACGIISRKQGQEKAGAMGLGWCKGWPQEVSSHRELNPRDRSRSRFVVSVAGGNGNGWFKNLLLSKIEIPDVDLGGLDDDDEDMNGDGDGDGDGDEGEGEGEGEVDDEDDEDLEEVDFEFSREPAGDEVDELIEDDTRFARWKRKMDAKNELREFQASGRDPDSKDWEDWLDDTWEQYDVNLAGEDGWYQPAPDWEKDGVPRDPPTKPERGMRRTIKELFFRIFEREEEVADDLQFEERVFRFTSQSTAKFVGVLIVVPWVADFLVHDFLLVPFLNTYVEKVPLAAKVLDIRESQKLRIIDRLKLERQRVRFEAEIGKAPPLSDDELAEHIREEALELREELRLENRLAFANIWSDFTAGLTILLLLVLNKRQVAIMRLTGERLFTNISDTGKAFIIILLTDIFLGYHSESGWETVSEMVLEHYGFEVSQAAIYIFVAIVPVTIDACFKLWVFRFFRTLSPSASATFREMQRH